MYQAYGREKPETTSLTLACNNYKPRVVDNAERTMSTYVRNDVKLNQPTTPGWKALRATFLAPRYIKDVTDLRDWLSISSLA